jgi:hypothetical protein
MSSASNARSAALEAVIDSHAVELKLPTLRRQFRSLAEQAVREQPTPVEYLAALLEAETAERAPNGIHGPATGSTSAARNVTLT